MKRLPIYNGTWVFFPPLLFFSQSSLHNHHLQLLPFFPSDHLLTHPSTPLLGRWPSAAHHYSSSPRLLTAAADPRPSTPPDPISFINDTPCFTSCSHSPSAASNMLPELLLLFTYPTVYISSGTVYDFIFFLTSLYHLKSITA